MEASPIPDFEALYPGGPRFPVGGRSQKLGTDSLMLAYFPKISGVSLAADLGCGAASLILLLAARSSGIRVHGIEICPETAGLGRAALEENGLLDSCRVITGDLRISGALPYPGQYDLVVSNPPYFPIKSGKSASDVRRALARDERSCSLAELCAAAATLLRHRGAFALVHRPERLSQLFGSMSEAGLEPKRLRFVTHCAGRSPSLVLIEGRRGAAPGLKVEPELILFDRDGRESPEIRAIYNR